MICHAREKERVLEFLYLPEFATINGFEKKEREREQSAVVCDSRDGRKCERKAR